MGVSLSQATAELTAAGQMFELGDEVVAGVETRVWRNCPPTLRSILELSALHGDATFLVYEDERLTFADHFARVCSLAHILSDRYGVTRGDRVVIAMRNLPEWVLSFWAAAALGAVVVPLNAWWTGPELEYGISDSGCKLAILDGERLDRIAPRLAALRPGLEHVLVARIEHRSDSARELVAGVDLFEDVVMAPAGPSPGIAMELPAAQIGPDDNATIFYTSGTTGSPKGALGTQRNICTNLMSLGFIAARTQLMASPEVRAAHSSGNTQNAYLLSVPLFHATGCHSILVANLAVGGKIVMMRRWNPERALELIERERITNFGGVPTMAWQVLNSPDFSWRDTSSVRSVGYGGAPAPPELVRRIEQHFPKGSASNGYGLTETSSVTTMNTGEDYVRKPDSVGPPVPVCEIRVVDDAGSDVAAGEPGELMIKGPNVVSGYWNKPEDTERTFRNRWLLTGDVARVDEEGFVYIVDRAKDMLIRGGENVYSVEVEAAIYEHPTISEVAVIGVPHEVLGEEVGAVVVLRPGASLDLAGLREFLSERVAAFKIPAHLYLRDEALPRNAAGKVLKRELRSDVLGTQ